MRGLAGASGLLTDEYRYSAYGALQTHTGANENPYLYARQQFDATSGLYSLRARYYAPEAGRFLSRDTYPLDAANPVEWNRYGYTAGNPVNRADPSGKSFLYQYSQPMQQISLPSQQFLVVVGVGVASIYLGLILALSPDIPRIHERWEPNAQEWQALINAHSSSQHRPTPDPEPEPQPKPVPAKPRIDPFIDPREKGEIVVAFRGVDGERNSKGYYKPNLGTGQFKLRPTDIDGLSIFELYALPGNKPYAVSFEILYHPPKTKGAIGQIVGLPYTAIFDIQGLMPGHWSIQCQYDPEGSKLALSNYAKASAGVIKNPNYNGDLPIQ